MLLPFRPTHYALQEEPLSKRAAPSRDSFTEPKLQMLVTRFRRLADRNPAAANAVLEIGDWVLSAYGA